MGLRVHKINYAISVSGKRFERSGNIVLEESGTLVSSKDVIHVTFAKLNMLINGK